MRDVLERLNEIGDDHNALIEGTIHFNKSTGVDILDRIMNSRAISVVSRDVAGRLVIDWQKVSEQPHDSRGRFTSWPEGQQD